MHLIKNITVYVFVFIFSFSFMKADVFMMQIPELPIKANREMYEDENLFSITVLKYYAIASSLEVLIRMHGLVPVSIVPIPNYEDLEDAEFKTLVKYHKLCVDLKIQYDDSGLDFRDVEVEKLFNEIRQCKLYNMKLQSDNRALKLSTLRNSFYSKTMDSLLFDLEESNYLVDSLTWAVYREKRDVYKNIINKINQSKMMMYPVLSGIAGASQFYLYNNRLESRTGIFTFLVFNPGPLLNIGRYFDFRVGLSNYTLFNESDKFYCKNYEYNFDFIIPVHQIFDFNNFNIELKLGLGFFAGNAYTPNIGGPSREWYGELFRLELSSFNFGYEFPIGMSISYNFYHNNKEIDFGNGAVVGKNWSNSLMIGLTFPLWNKVF